MRTKDNQRMFMNKKMLCLFVVVAVPSISLAGNRHVCEDIIKNLNDRISTDQSVSAIHSDISLNISGISNLREIIVSATAAKNSGKSDLDAFSACKDEVYRQTVMSAESSSRRNRNGNIKTDGSSTGGAVGGAVAGSGNGMAMDLTPELRNLRLDSSTHESGNIIGKALSSAATLAECNVLAETESCGLTPFTASLSFLGAAALETSKILPLDTQHCSCIEAKASKVVGNEAARAAQVSNEVRDMNNMVTIAFGKKFINDYATHLEDIRYYTKNAKQVFSGRDGRQSTEAENLRCSKVSEYRAAVQKTCGRSLSDSQINSKLQKIFGVLGQGQGFGYLQKLDEKVMVNIADDGRKFRRDEFDIIRNGMVKEDKNIRFADNIVATLLKDNTAKKAILANEDTPKEGILRYLTEQIRTDNKFFNRYLNKEMLGEKVFNEMSNQFKDTTVALEVIRGKLEWAMQVHPGFEGLMKNKKIFGEASSAIRNSSNSAIDTLETSDNILKPDLIERCEGLKNNLAEFLCTDEGALVSHVPKNELRNLIRASGRQNDLVMADLAICQNGSNTKNGAFAKLIAGKNDRESDILERIGSTKLENQKNLFTKIMLQNGKSGDSETRNAIARVAEEGFRNRRGLTNDSFGRQFEVADGDKMSFFSPEIEKSMRNEIAGTVAKEDTRTIINNSSSTQLANNEVPQMASPAYMNNYSAALKDYQETVGAKPATQDKYDPRNDLREFLSNKENKESVDRLMKETDDSRVADLARLREESEKNREQLLKLATDNEKLKLKQMQDQLSDLEQKRSKAVSANVAPEEDDEIESDPRSSGRGSRDIASVSSGESSGVNSGSFSGGKSGGSAGGSGSTSTISNAKNELSNGLSGIGDGTASEPVVISAATARSGSLEIKSTELSKEILNFLETEPDVQTLIKMRQSGMIYKYKVMENGKEVMKEITINYTALTDDVKKLIEQKIADSGKAGSEAKRLSSEIKDLRRAYSYNALKIILGEQMKARR